MTTKKESPLGVDSRGPEKHSVSKIGLDLIQDTVLPPEHQNSSAAFDLFGGSTAPVFEQEESYPATSFNDFRLPDDTEEERAAFAIAESRLKHKLLRALLADVGPVDFASFVGEDGDVRAVHHRIYTVQELIRIAENRNWGLSQRNSATYFFNGQFWQALDAEDMRSFLGIVALKMGVPSTRALDYKFRDELFRQFQSLAHLSAPEAGPETTRINLINGTFVVGPGGHKLREFRQEDFMRYCLPFGFDSLAEAPLFKRYLLRVLPDESSRRVLQEYCGYVFIRGLKLEKVLLLYGSGANGKSVFHAILTAMLGPENCSAYSLGSLTESRSGYHRAMLADKLLNFCSELHGNIEADVFKLLASGEPIEARLPYERPFILTDYARLIFNTNELPHEVEHTHAFFRRFLIVPFTETIPQQEQDPDLAAKIVRNELPGVFNWVIEGLDRLLKQRRFSECRAADEALAQYRLESDSVSMFVQERGYRRSATGELLLQHIYQEYRDFCSDDGFRALGKTKFSKRLQGAGLDVQRTYKGVIVFTERPESARSDPPFSGMKKPSTCKTCKT